MMMQTRRFTYEHLAWIMIWILALGIRLVNLGEVPLSEFEAGWAIQSWEAAQGESFAVGPNPGYIFPTAALFFIFESSNFLARFWPALVGSLAVLALYGFRRLLSREAALIAALGLALDPGMVALSRLAGGPMMALGFGLLAMAFWVNRRFIATGIFGALALISGPAVGMGLIGLAIAWGIGRWIGVSAGDNLFVETEPLENPVRSFQDSIRLGLMFGAGVALLVSTLFFRYPSGLGAWAGAFAEFFKGWGNPSGIPALRLPAVVVFYQPLALIFGLIAAVRGWVRHEKTARWLSIWLLAALLLPMFYTGRQVLDVIWAFLPLWSLAALELRRHLRISQPLIVSAVHGGVVFILLVLFWMVSQNLSPGTSTWLALLVVPLLIILATALVAMTWSWDTGRIGLVWGSSAALGLLVLASTFGASQIRSNRVSELWMPPPTTVQSDLLVNALKDIAIQQNGRDDVLEIVSLVEDPSLRWVLRGFEGVRFAPSLSQDVYPDILITMGSNPNLAQLSFYRGQDFVWYEFPGWDGVMPLAWFDWLISRQAPVGAEWMVLWARADLFPGDVSDDQNVELQPEQGGGIE